MGFEVEALFAVLQGSRGSCGARGVRGSSYCLSKVQRSLQGCEEVGGGLIKDAESARKMRSDLGCADMCR